MQEYSNNGQPFIVMQAVSFAYPRGKPVLQNLSVNFARNQFTAITGPNGSGKTTLGKLLSGIFKPTGGQVLLAGRDTKELRLGEVGQMIGYLFQEPGRQLFAPSVSEELSFALELRGFPPEQVSAKVEQMLKLFHLEELVDEFPFHLSRGEKQRLALATIFMNEPGFLILDEPTTGLDQERRRELTAILQGLKHRGAGLIVISHDEEFINDNAERIIVLEGGEIRAETEI